MIEGAMSSLKRTKLNKETQILELECSCYDQENNSNSGSNRRVCCTFEQDIATSSIISKTPLIPDPWEASRFVKDLEPVL